ASADTMTATETREKVSSAGCKANLTASVTCVAAIERLAEFGHELRRPLAVLGHPITKEDAVPPVEIERCIRQAWSIIKMQRPAGPDHYYGLLTLNSSGWLGFSRFGSS